MSGWWAEQFARFQLELSPEIGIAGEEAYFNRFSLSFTPSISIEGRGISTADLAISLESSLSFLSVEYIGTIALDLTPLIAMDAVTHSTATIDLSLTPAIGMTGEERYTAQFGLTLTPTIGQVAYVKQLPHPVPWTL